MRERECTNDCVFSGKAVFLYRQMTSEDPLIRETNPVACNRYNEQYKYED